MLRTQTTQTPDRGTVLGKAVLRSADRLNLSGKTLAAVLGLSEPQISRLKKGTAPLNEQTKAFELAALLVRAFRSLDAITGGDETAARAWMRANNTALGGRPVELITSIQGLTNVCTYLDARRAPV